MYKTCDSAGGSVFEIEIDGRSLVIRQDMLVAIENYIDHHKPTGGFLEAIISNQLREALGRADPENLKNIQAFIAFFIWEAPSTCWGSPTEYKDWTTSVLVSEESN